MQLVAVAAVTRWRSRPQPIRLPTALLAVAAAVAGVLFVRQRSRPGDR